MMQKGDADRGIGGASAGGGERSPFYQIYSFNSLTKAYFISNDQMYSPIYNYVNRF